MSIENKKILNSDLGRISLITIPLFFIFFAVNKNFLLSFLVSIFIFSYTLFTIKWSKSKGMKRHQNIINSQGFQQLILKGFKVEKVNEYSGITGVYDEYICDIYYDWSTFVLSQITKAWIINIYFIPPKPLDKINNANYDFIMAMRKKYRISRWSFKSYGFDWREGAIIMKNSIGSKNPSFEKIEEALKIAIDILKKENLKPISREDLMYIRNNFPYQSVPWISTYHKKNE